MGPRRASTRLAASSSTNSSNVDAARADPDACSACGDSGARVIITCAACARRLHLSCASPPLTRRPALASAWRCDQCGADRKPALTTRKREKKDVDDADNEEEEEELQPRKSRRTSGKAKAVKAVKAAPKKTEQKQKQRAAVGDDDAEDVDDDADDDADSDFTGAESDESDESEVSVASDEDFERKPKRRLPTLKTPPKAARPAPAKKPRATAAAPPAPENGYDSLELPSRPTESGAPEGGSDSDGEADDVYAGPSYFVEYGPNNRARCKQCEQKLLKDALRVGVRVRHSIFGLTTYFKHVACTQICLSTVSSEAQVAEGAVDPIPGFSALRKADQVVVRAHMVAVEAQQLLDERLALSEDHYAKKARMPEKEPSPLLTDAARDVAVRTGLKVPAKARRSAQESRPRGGTLVVCPLVAVMQWKSEIERFVERGRLSIYIHHGPKRRLSPAQIAAFDIVLTTYSIIESEIRQTLAGDKVPCRYCAKKFLPAKLVLHNKYFCGPNAKKTARQGKQQSNKAKRKVAAGESGSDDSDASDDDDASYPKKPKAKAKARAPAKKAAKKAADNSDDDDDDDAPVAPAKAKTKSPLHQVSWTRIVLDEAHYIKDRRNNTARGVFELKSEYKWCLTGTPLQNRIGELFSLIRFLQIKSYAYYHCSNCECQLLDFHFPDGKCELCEHTAMQHYSFFNKKIVIPIQAYGYVAEGKIAMLRLQNEVLQHILLRRTKEGRADDICLPPKLVRIRKDHLDERENDFYEAIYTQSQAQFNTYVSSGTLLNNYAHIFDLLIRLRQAVDHPYLVIFSKSNPALQLPASASAASGVTVRPVVQEKPLLSARSTADDDDDANTHEQLCAICHEDAEDPVAAKCGHTFCRECVKEFIESLPVGAEATCPSCSQLLTVELERNQAQELEDASERSAATSKPPKKSSTKSVDLSHYHKASILHRIADMESFQTSTKIEALMQELALMRQRDPSGKAIIFSQFVNMLDIIQHRLQLGGVKCVKLSGNMSMDVRDRTIKAFRDDSSITAFLISLKAGGVALNLTIASHIFLMDPWWNPAAESQAIDRTHRLGQFKPIQATRFIIAGTVEERILKLQEKKRLIFEGTVGASVSAVTRLTAEDLRFLFSK
ncbi:hypothetical protein PybrP1_009595 [[Pythium] brassicae (nom. inval.)]|nr:hypothetical protein PybrP1_009595 [[Pythium] brassicae (nom. inval.)]